MTLEEYGYSRTDTVEGQGQYASRGDILDVFSPDSDKPVRLEFFGDELDAAGIFDIMTQRRTENLQSVTFIPAKEVMLTAEKKQEVLEKAQKLLPTDIQPPDIPEEIRQGGHRFRRTISGRVFPNSEPCYSF